MGLEMLLHVVAVTVLLPAQATLPETVTKPDHSLLRLCACLLPQTADGGADHAASPGVGHQLVVITAETAYCVKLGVEKRLRVPCKFIKSLINF